MRRTGPKDPQRVTNIGKMFLDGFTYTEIGAKYGISASYVGHIVQLARSWAEVNDKPRPQDCTNISKFQLERYYEFREIWNDMHTKALKKRRSEQ